jgi:hypothetical protein
MKKKEIDIRPLFVMIIGFLLGLVLISLTSCDKTISEQIEKPIRLRQKSDDRFKNVTEFTYGGCEYIKVGFEKDAWGSHKGNCENPIHFENNPR